MFEYHCKNRAETDGLNPSHIVVATQLIEFAGKNVLDIGCGGGAFLKSISDKANSLLGVDPNPHNCVLAKRKGLKVIEGYFDSALRDYIREFNPQIISCFGVIEHLYSPMTLFSEVAIILSGRDGLFIVETPNAFHLVRAMDFVLKQKHRDPLLDPIRWDEPEHIRLFSYGMVEDGLLKAGFKKVNGYGVTVINNKPYKLTNKFMIKYLSQHLIFVAEVR